MLAAMPAQPEGARQAKAVTVLAGAVAVGAALLAWVLSPGFVAARLSGDGQLAKATAEWLALYAIIAWWVAGAAAAGACGCLVGRAGLRRVLARSPRVLPRLALVAGSTAVALLLGEGLVRVLGGGTSTNSAAYRNYSHDYRQGIAAQLDARGYRETRLETPPAPGTFRILAVGDSFVFGFGVASSEDTWPAAIERSLTGRSGPDAPRYQVLNAGRPGADSAREFAVLRELLPDVQPDLVLLGYYVNDCETVAEKRAYFASRRLLPVISENMERVSQLWWLLESVLVRRLEAAGLRPSYVEHLLAQTEPGSEAWAAHEADLRRLMERAGRPAVLVLFPLLTDFDDYPLSVLHERVAAVAEAAGLPVLDLVEAFAGIAPERLEVSPRDPHLNEYGLALAAEATVRFLVERELLPAAGGPSADPAAEPAARTATDR